MSPARSSSNPKAARAVREAPASDTGRASPATPAAAISSTRESIRLASSSRSIVSPTKTVGRRRRAVHRPSLDSGGGMPPCCSSMVRAMRLRSFGWIVIATSGSSSAQTASGPRSATSCSTSARISGGTGGRRSRSASAALRYSPVPPTTIGRRPSARSWSISACASAANRPALNSPAGSTKPTSRCSRRSRSSGVAAPLSVSSPRYTWIASQETATGSSPRARKSSAIAIATAVFPTPVGPKIARTVWAGSVTRLLNRERPPVSSLSRPSQPAALADLAPGHDASLALRIADLGRRRVAAADEIAPDPVGDVLVRVGIVHYVVAQPHVADHAIADESEPEAPVTGLRHASADHVVLDRGELTVSPVHPHGVEDVREMQLQRSGRVGVDAAVDDAGAGAILVTEDERGARLHTESFTDEDLRGRAVAAGTRGNDEPAVPAGGQRSSAISG